MEAVLLIGIPASGKTTFYSRQFLHTHVRISLDLLRTRKREQQFLDLCLMVGQPFVVDNTNVQPLERAVYIDAGRRAGFRIIGYYFQSVLVDCLARNDSRPGKLRIPAAGVRGRSGELILPTKMEGFDELFYVALDGKDGFVIEEWRDEAE